MKYLGVAIGYIFSGISAVPVIILCFQQNNYALALSVLSVFGITGWSIGILLSPRREENKQFNSILATLGSFLSGYLVSKFDPAINTLANINDENSIGLQYAIIAIFSFVNGVLLTFIWRKTISIRDGTPVSEAEHLRNLMIAYWAAELRGRDESFAADYAIQIIREDLRTPGHDDVVERLTADLAGVVDEATIRAKMAELLTKANAKVHARKV